MVHQYPSTCCRHDKTCVAGFEKRYHGVVSAFMFATETQQTIGKTNFDQEKANESLFLVLEPTPFSLSHPMHPLCRLQSSIPDMQSMCKYILGEPLGECKPSGGICLKTTALHACCHTQGCHDKVIMRSSARYNLLLFRIWRGRPRSCWWIAWLSALTVILRQVLDTEVTHSAFACIAYP